MIGFAGLSHLGINYSLATTAKGDFETVRTFLSAGAPLPADTSRRFRERFGLPIHTFYGCSECGF